jgi:hypothetical protein
MKLVRSANVWLAGNELATETGNFPWGSPAFCSVPPHPATKLATASTPITMTLRPLTEFEHTQAAGGVSVRMILGPTPVSVTDRRLLSARASRTLALWRAGEFPRLPD